MVRRRGGTDADAYVDLPNRGHIEIGDEEDLLLLAAHGRNVADRAVVRIPLDAAANDTRKVVTDLGTRREAKALIDIRTMQGALERGIDREIPAADALVDDRTYFPGPGIGRVGRALKPDFGREAHAHRPPPGIRYPNARANVISHPLHATAVLLAGKDVETNFRPIIDAFGELDRLVLLVVGRIDAIDELLLAFHGEIRVKFDHQGLRRDCRGPIDLDLVIGLGTREKR